MIDQPLVPGLGAYTALNAATYCGVSLTRLQAANREGELDAVYPDSDPRYTPEALDEWISSWPRTKPVPRKRT